jgi:tetratricopeptide (TPR) repeat protein
MKKAVFLMMLALTAVSCSGAISQTQTAFPYADIPMGARPTALSGAYAGISDIDSINYNPGALGFLNTTGVSFTYTKWNLDTGVQYMNGVLPAGPGVFGCSIIYADMGKIDGRTESGDLTGQQLSAYGLGGTIAFGAMVNRDISAGGSVRILSQSMDGVSNGGILLDAGSSYRINRNFSAGLDYRGFSFSDRPLDSSILDIGGVFYTGENDPDRLMAACDLKYSIAYGPSACLGLEYVLSNIAAFRAGYDIKSENSSLGGLPGISFGFGLSLGAVKIDYAAVSFGELGLNNTLAVSFQFEGGVSDRNVYEKLISVLAGQYLADAQEYAEAGDYDKAIRKLQTLKALTPDYPGIEEKIAETMGMSDKNGMKVRMEALFNAGMDYYIRGMYKDAVIKWSQLKQLGSDFPGIDSWLKHAQNINDKSDSDRKNEQCFREGMAFYNKCMYDEALARWKDCDFGNSDDNRMAYLEKRSAEMMHKIRDKEKEAEKFLDNGDIYDGVKKVRVILSICPMSDFAKGKIQELKTPITKQAEALYRDGLDKYTGDDIAGAINCWEKVIELDSSGTKADKSRDNIERVKVKLRNMKLLDMKMKDKQ